MLRSVLAALLLPAAAVAGEPDRPNILFVMSDDHAAHAVGAYGGRLAGLDPTPHLDRLAAEGVRFTNAFCGNSICVPLRDIHATMQHLMGLDHNKLTVPFRGPDQKLTGVKPARVVTEALA